MAIGSDGMIQTPKNCHPTVSRARLLADVVGPSFLHVDRPVNRMPRGDKMEREQEPSGLAALIVATL